MKLILFIRSVIRVIVTPEVFDIKEVGLFVALPTA